MHELSEPDVQLPPPAGSRASLALKWLISLALAGFFVWLTARKWPLDKLFGGDLSVGTDASGRTAIQLIDAGVVSWSFALVSLAGSLAIYFAIHWLRVIRWRQFLAAFAPAPLKVVNRVGAVGFMAIFLLPFRLGEVVRPLLIARHTDVPFGTAVATIAVERVVDGLMVSLLLFVVLLGTPDSQLARYPEVQYGGYVALSVFGGAMAVLIATAVARDLTIRILRTIVGTLSGGLADKIIGVATAFVDGIRVLHSPAAVIGFVAITAVYWAITALNIWVIGDGFGVQMPLVAGVTMTCCIVVGMMIPNTPGNVGSFWYFMLLPAGLYGIDPETPTTIGFALGVWFLTMANQAVYGTWGLWARQRLPPPK